MLLSLSEEIFFFKKRKKPWKNWILSCGKFTETGINYISHVKKKGGGRGVKWGLEEYNSLHAVRENGKRIKLPRMKKFQSNPETWVKSWQFGSIVLSWLCTSSSYFCSLDFGNSWEWFTWSANNPAAKSSRPKFPFSCALGICLAQIRRSHLYQFHFIYFSVLVVKFCMELNGMEILFPVNSHLLSTTQHHFKCLQPCILLCLVRGLRDVKIKQTPEKQNES